MMVNCDTRDLIRIEEFACSRAHTIPADIVFAMIKVLSHAGLLDQPISITPDRKGHYVKWEIQIGDKTEVGDSPFGAICELYDKFQGDLM